LLINVQAMDTDDKTNGDKAPAPKTRKVKKQVRMGDLTISAGTASLDQAQKDAFAEKEGQMIAEDKLVADTEDKKNELESQIYAMRSKIEEPYSSNGYSDFASEDEKAKVKAKAEELEVSAVPDAVHAMHMLIHTRNGSTTTATTPPKHNTSPRWTSSAVPQVP